MMSFAGRLGSLLLGVSLAGASGCGDGGAMRRADSGTRLDAGAGADDAGPMGTEDGGSRMDDAGSELPTDAGPIADGGTVTIDGGSVTTDAGNMPTDAGTITGPSWSAEVYPLISSNCSPCHTERASGALDMSSATAAYADLVDVDAAGPACGSGSRVRVVPGDAAGSLLYQKVAGTHDCGSQMPLAAPALSDGQIATIGDWIDAGASDD